MVYGLTIYNVTVEHFSNVRMGYSLRSTVEQITRSNLQTVVNNVNKRLSGP
jgi:hypothetical protein